MYHPSLYVILTVKYWQLIAMTVLKLIIKDEMSQKQTKERVRILL